MSWLPAEAPAAMKILLAGGFGVGKTTMVASVSEIAPVSTETYLTEASRRLDDTGLVPGKQATTVALDFGRITVDTRVVLYLFGTPGQRRFWFMWDQLARGAWGAVVLVDVRRLADSFAPIDYLEQATLPFVVCINQFDDAPLYPTEVVRDALSLGPQVPVLSCDARRRAGAKQVLIGLVEHLAARYRRPRLPPPARARAVPSPVVAAHLDPCPDRGGYIPFGGL